MMVHALHRGTRSESLIGLGRPNSLTSGNLAIVFNGCVLHQ
jgi:hypothetical protein